jgi:peptidoglycan/xylan/chitin deacetylase (PgdA/CDA1 family)
MDRFFIALIFSVVLFSLGSCVPFWAAEKKEPPVGPKTIEEHTVYRSEDYVICHLQHKDDAARLAEEYLGGQDKAWIIEDANQGSSFEKDQRIVIPLNSENIGGLTPDGYQVVPVLCYHRFSDACDTNLCVSKHVFESHLKYLQDNAYRVITMAQLLGFLEYRHPIPRRSVMITIDDGYRSAYDIAYPVLRRYAFPATVFIFPNLIGKSDEFMTWEQLREMKAQGFEVGSHALSHADLTKKMKDEEDAAYMGRVRKELVFSKKIIDKALDQNTICLAFPFGKFRQRLLPLCEEAGYKMAFTLTRGENPFFADPLTLKRSQILKTDMESFVSRLKTLEAFSSK